MVCVGVIGAGLMGTIHARLLSAAVSGAEVIAVSDAVRGSAERIAAEIAVDAVYEDGFELIADPGVDAVVIASPVETHEPFTLACLERGKPVLCEKPLAATAESARRIVAAEAARGRRSVTVGFMRRCDPAYADMKARLDAGAVGAPLLVHCAHRNPSVHSFFDSAMIITDTVVHEIDVVRWLLDDEIVRASVLTPRPSSRARAGLRDPQVVILETAGGRIVDVEAFVTAGYGYDIRCEIVGEAGTIELLAPATVAVRRELTEAMPVPPGFPQRFGAAYVRELEGWIAAIRSGEEPAGPSAWDGYAAAAVCQAAVASLESGAPVDVALGDPPSLYRPA
jgi:myo-inositol 2-dehydrogenase/D-chiro-inositol 1-dehydrogenase